MRIDDLFKDFLIENDYYDGFMYNILKHHKSDDINHFIEVVYKPTQVNKNIYGNMISIAFPWDKTPEGGDYWYAVAIAWSKFYNAYKHWLSKTFEAPAKEFKSIW